MPSYRTGTIYAEITNCGRYSRMRPIRKNRWVAVITVKNKIEDRVILDMIEKMIDNGYVVRTARTGMRTHASAVSIMTNRENRFVESGGLTNAIAKLAKKVMGEN